MKGRDLATMLDFSPKWPNVAMKRARSIPQMVQVRSVTNRISTVRLIAASGSYKTRSISGTMVVTHEH